MEHKHATLIKQWADDTSLVVLGKDTGSWVKLLVDPKWFIHKQYFIVCSKHVEVALHWLNGGDVERLFAGHELGWCKLQIEGAEFYESCEYRIKPKFEKVKVWIGVKNPEADVMYSNIVTSGTKPIGNEYFDNFTWTEVEANKLIK